MATHKDKNDHHLSNAQKKFLSDIENRSQKEKESSHPRATSAPHYKSATTGIGNNLYRMEAGAARMVFHQSYRNVIGGGELSEGLDAASLGLTAASALVTNIGHGSIRNSLKSDFSSSYNELRERIPGLPQITTFDHSGVMDAKRALQMHFKESGLGSFKDYNATQTIGSSMRLNLKRGGVMTETDRAAVLTYKKLGVLENNQQSHQSFRRVGSKFVALGRRHLRDDDTLKGITFSDNVIRKSQQSIRASIRAAQATRRLIASAAKIAFKTSAALAAKAAKSELALFKAARAQKEALEKTKLMEAAKQANNKMANSKFSTGAKASIEKYNKAKVARLDAKAKASKAKVLRKLNNKFSSNYWSRRLRERIAKTSVGKLASKVLRPVNKLARFLGTGNAIIKTLVSSVLKYIGLAFLGVVAIVAILSLIMMGVSYLSSALDATANENAIKHAIGIIQEEYEEDMNSLEIALSRYSSSRVVYEDIRDEDAYESPANLPETPFTQSTNVAELISMALVQFEFDLGSADKESLETYLRQLYTGSHTISIQSTDTHATATIKTYYFNDLFDCKLIDDTVILETGQIEQTVWTYLTQRGIPEIQTAGIMGNIYRESGFRPDAIESGNGIGLGLCQWSFGRRDNLEAYAASQGKPPSDLQVQLEFLMTELQPSYFNSYYTGVNNYQYFMNATNTADAVYYFCWGWERPAGWAGEASMKKGQDAAASYYAQFSTISNNGPVANP